MIGKRTMLIWIRKTKNNPCSALTHVVQLLDKCLGGALLPVWKQSLATATAFTALALALALLEGDRVGGGLPIAALRLLLRFVNLSQNLCHRNKKRTNQSHRLFSNSIIQMQHTSHLIVVAEELRSAVQTEIGQTAEGPGVRSEARQPHALRQDLWRQVGRRSLQAAQKNTKQFMGSISLKMQNKTKMLFMNEHYCTVPTRHRLSRFPPHPPRTARRLLTYS